ncbi:hypothetical protein HOK021_39270 [Streptomyces hygroscopicus]|nr:hypothetical protein HOK021_39270 [Streptomyces hygroscopicus]
MAGCALGAPGRGLNLPTIVAAPHPRIRRPQGWNGPPAQRQTRRSRVAFEDHSVSARRESFSSAEGVGTRPRAGCSAHEPGHPAQWMPPAADAQCTYLSDWVSTKLHWSLTVDRAGARAQENYRRDVGANCLPGRPIGRCTPGVAPR